MISALSNVMLRQFSATAVKIISGTVSSELKCCVITAVKTELTLKFTPVLQNGIPGAA